MNGRKEKSKRLKFAGCGNSGRQNVQTNHGQQKLTGFEGRLSENGSIQRATPVKNLRTA
jgi:hypothetical protein